MDKSSENSISSESTFNDDLENIDEQNEILSKKLEKNVQDKKSVKDEKSIQKEKPSQKQNKPVEIQKARQLLTLADERDYEDQQYSPPSPMAYYPGSRNPLARFMADLPNLDDFDKLSLEEAL